MERALSEEGRALRTLGFRCLSRDEKGTMRSCAIAWKNKPEFHPRSGVYLPGEEDEAAREQGRIQLAFLPLSLFPFMTPGSLYQLGDGRRAVVKRMERMEEPSDDGD